METATDQLPSRNFQPRLYGVGAWTDHLHFAYDVIAALRPRVFVELGTDRGESYFAFCQSVVENETGTRCVAIDSWRGDTHAGGYDETTHAEVTAHNRAHYENFSTLRRAPFADARTEFADESIDLLHLDGLHTEDAVREDLRNWLPKLRPGRLLLMHDVNVRARDFGVWKVWAELMNRGRAHAFCEGPGLGVWQKPPAQTLPEPLETLLAGPSDRREQLAEYYREKAQMMQLRIADHWRDGSIRETAAAQQTTIQIFHTEDGVHREDDSVFARVGHEDWKDVSILLPPGAGLAPLRIDFLSAYMVIDLAALRVISGRRTIFTAENAAEFDRIRVAGDAERQPHPRYLQLRITGVDPQLYLPPITTAPDSLGARVEMRLRVSAREP